MAIFYLFILAYDEIILKRKNGSPSKTGLDVKTDNVTHTYREGMKRLIIYIMKLLEEHGWSSQLAQK